MNYIKVVEEDLRTYESRKQALVNLKDRITALKARVEGIHSGFSDSIPQHGGGNATEERLIDCFTELERMKLNYRATEPLIRMETAALAKLSKDEYTVLDRFYMHRERDHVERLCDELHLSKSEVYRKRDAALRKIAIEMYSVPDL